MPWPTLKNAVKPMQKNGQPQRTTKQNDGDAAEAIAAAWLIKKGLKIRLQNYHCRSGEIDLIAEQIGDSESELVIVEVRYRGNGAAVDAVSSVDARKQRRIISATAHFLASNPALADTPLRFDVLAMSGRLNKPDILWIQDAFQ